MRNFLFSTAMIAWGILLVVAVIHYYEISKCEQGGLHCEMRAIPVMEMRE